MFNFIKHFGSSFLTKDEKCTGFYTGMYPTCMIVKEKHNMKIKDSHALTKALKGMSFWLFCTMLLTGISGNALGETTYGFNGHRYAVFDSTLSWSEAKACCEEKGGHLATITSAAEQAFIESINSSQKWIGGYRNDDNVWRWVTGEAWAYTNWADGEPNDSSNVISNENRVAVWPVKWNDLNENSREQSGFICEWDYDNVDISKASVALSKTKYTYNGKAKKPSATVKLGGETLKKNKDYSVSYISNVDVGNAYAEISGMGNYTGLITNLLELILLKFLLLR